MLITLHIENVVLIDRLTIDFRQGLCALTGETGAGKSILLDSVGLALGARAETRLVRKGADQAQVIAEFQMDKRHPARQILAESNIAGGEFILRRTLTPDGRSRAFINDQPVSAGLLRQVGDSLMEIHGQFDTHSLFNPSTHRGILDEYAGLSSAVSDLWHGWRAADAAFHKMQQNAENLQAEEAFLRQSIEDLDTLAPQAGEAEYLKNVRDQLMNREHVLKGLAQAADVLGDDHDPVQKALGILDKIADKGGEAIGEALAALERASAEVQEALSLTQSASARLVDEELDLEGIDERLYTLRAQARKHGCDVDALAEKRDELAAQLDLIEHGDAALAALAQKAEAARVDYMAEAEAVHAVRVATAERLSENVQAELPPLKLDKARFVVDVAVLPEQEWGPYGMDQVRFLVSTNPGSEPGALNKIASGGETARFMLALKVVMAAVGHAGTLIFDEVDAGVGGAVADAVGERLEKLARDKQVLVVTHAPQIASRAAHHWIVSKSGDQEVTTTVIYQDSLEERREEIARMLSGTTVSEEARAAANKLLESAS